MLGVTNSMFVNTIKFYLPKIANKVIFGRNRYNRNFHLKNWYKLLVYDTLQFTDNNYIIVRHGFINYDKLIK